MKIYVTRTSPRTLDDDDDDDDDETDSPDLVEL